MTAEPGTAWMNDAACASPLHRGLPWLDDTHTLPAVLVEVMGAVCAGCPVLAACAGYVTVVGVAGGFWAGADRDPAAILVVQLDLLEDGVPLEPVDDLEHGDQLGGAA